MVLLAAGGAVLFSASGLLAGVVGTPHDFSATGPYSKGLGPGGACSVCHIPHGAKDSVLWRRYLGDNITTGYLGKLKLADGTGDNNYIYGTTLLCYDCHDYAGDPTPFTGHSTVNEQNVFDNNYNLSDPPKGSFLARHRPQDVAFGLVYQTLLPPPGGFDGDWTDDGPGGTVPGYFENDPPNNFPARDFVRFGVGNPTGNPRIGGHYFKSGDPIATGTNPLKRGDKIPCSDCHDPHDYTTQAFIRSSVRNIPGAPSPIGKASEYMSNQVSSPPIGRLRDNEESRNMCNACHTLAGSASITYSQINPGYQSFNVVQRPIAIAEHLAGSVAPCTQCHSHNNIFASCTQCHGFPPGPGPDPRYPVSTRFVPTAPVDNDSHPRHYGASSGQVRTGLYRLDCEVCHYLSTGAGTQTGIHQNGLVSVVIAGGWTKSPNGPSGQWDNTNYFNPLQFPGYPPAIPGVRGQLDNGTTSTGWGYTPPLTLGGNACRNVYCHSAGRAQTSMGLDCTVEYRVPRWNSGPLHCNDCHGPGTDNTTAGGIRFGMPDYPTGPPGSASANSHRKHVDAGQECYECHSGTADNNYSGPNRRILGTTPTKHVNGLREVGFFDNALWGYNLNPGVESENKRCDVACHGTGRPLDQRPQWGGTLSCDGCHQSQGAGKLSKTYSGVHRTHTDNTGAVSLYNIACEVCHAAKASARPNTVHVNGDNSATPRYVEVRFTDNASLQPYDNTGAFRSFDMWTARYAVSPNPTPAYVDNGVLGGTDAINVGITWSTGSCANVWCHSNANPATAGGGNNLYRAPAWAAPASPRCVLCHLGPDGYDNMVATVTTPANGGMSHGHQVHLATDRYRFTCDECHANTVATDCTTALNASTGYAQHVNGSKSVSGQDVRGGTGVRFSPINDNILTYTAGRTCTSTYCHSAGVDNDAAGGFDNAVESPAWNSGSTGCTSCHGGNLASGKPMATGKHLKHLQDGYRCSNCHALTIAPNSDNVIKTTPDGNGRTGYDYHVNGVKDYVAGDGYSFTPGSCNNISCHGGTGTTWTGPPIGCSTCHLSNNADNDYYLSGTDNLYTAQNPPGIDNAEWVWSGHGKPSGNYDVSNFPAANFPGGVSGSGDPCNFCHDNAVAHNTQANPFRLKNQTGVSGYGALGWNATCLVCHSGSPVAPGYDPDGPGGSDYASRKGLQSFADNAHYGTEHASTRNGGKFCWDCHDPHGDRTASNGNNIFMIHGGSAARGGTAVSRLLRVSDNTYGIRGSSGALTTNAPVFTGIASGTNYADNTTFRGICQVCHTQGTTGHYRENFGDGHNASSRCTQCHKHDTAFAPSECKGCHGPEGVATAQAAPNVGTYWTSSGHGMTTPKAINVQCDACHDTGFVTGLDHKVDGSAGAGPPPANINTQIWPGKTEDANNRRNQNTAHLRSDFFPAGYPGSTPANKYEFARAFDLKCGGPATGCHPAAAHNQHPIVPATPQPVDRVMRFPDGGTAPDPKVYYWYPAISNYATQFYQSRSPWDINDLTTGAAGSYADNSVRYGVCVSCHDPHGTAAPANLGSATNQMLRGDTLNPGQFCNAACHTTRTPP